MLLWKVVQPSDSHFCTFFQQCFRLTSNIKKSHISALRRVSRALLLHQENIFLWLAVRWPLCFQSPLNRGLRVPVFDQFGCSGGKPTISFYSFLSVPTKFTNSSISHLLKSTSIVCKAAALLISGKKGYEDSASSFNCGTFEVGVLPV